jgi:intracellular sulfur oxidation DsrE/DsrF family protein
MTRLLVSAAALAAASIISLAMSLPAAEAQDSGTTTRPAVKRTSAQKPAAKTAEKPAPAKQHKVAIQVDENNPQVMNLALNNAKNIVDYYKSKGEEVAIEMVTFGPGLHMLRDDTSPVKQRISVMALESPNITFIACGNTQANQSKAENKQVALISEAKVVPSGVVRLMELQGKGYAYIRP